MLEVSNSTHHNEERHRKIKWLVQSHKYLKANFFTFYLFIFVFTGSLLLQELCSSFSELSRGYSSFDAWSSQCCRARALGQVSFSSCSRWASVVVAPRFYNTGPVVVVPRLSCSTACGIFPDQGTNPCLLHWLVDYLPLSHQRSP